MQSFSTIPETEELRDSRARINNINETLLSCNAGAAFPTANLKVGMFCFRTDQQKLYELTDATAPTWKLIADLSGALATAPNADKLDGRDSTGFMFQGLDGSWNRHDGSSRTWYGRIGSSNSTNDRTAFLGTYGDNAVVAAHNYALTAWAPIHVNCLDGTGIGGSVVLSTSTTVGPHTNWHAGNDGAGSGLDADLLDGLHATSFLLKDQVLGNAFVRLNSTYGGHVLRIENDSRQEATVRFRAKDPSARFVHSDIGVHADNTGGDKGYFFVKMPYNNSVGSGIKFSVDDAGGIFAGTPSSGNKLWHAGNDGPGSGLDADTLDGYHASHFATASSAWPGVYTGSDVNNVNYPIGAYVHAHEAAGVNRNQTATIWLDPGNGTLLRTANPGGSQALAGTWRCRGYSNQGMLFQRVA